MTKFQIQPKAGLWILLLGIGCLVLVLLPEVTQAAEKIYEVVADDTSTVSKLWTTLRSLVNLLVAGFLILVAFSNVLPFNIETYAVKKVLPGLLLGFGLANFSLLLSETFLNIAASVTEYVAGLPADIGGAGGLADTAPVPALVQTIFAQGRDGAALAAGIGIAGLATVANPTTWFFWGIVVVVLALIFLLPMALIYGMMWLRFYYLQLLVGVAPLAMIGMAIPWTQGLANWWWKQFLTWTFLKAIVYLILSAGVILLNNGLSGGGGVVVPQLILFIVGVGLLYAAVIVPFQMGGWVMKGAAGLAGLGLTGAAVLGTKGAGKIAGRLEQKPDFAARPGLRSLARGLRGVERANPLFLARGLWGQAQHHWKKQQLESMAKVAELTGDATAVERSEGEFLTPEVQTADKFDTDAMVLEIAGGKMQDKYARGAAFISMFGRGQSGIHHLVFKQLEDILHNTDERGLSQTELESLHAQQDAIRKTFNMSKDERLLGDKLVGDGRKTIGREEAIARALGGSIHYEYEKDADGKERVKRRDIFGDSFVGRTMNRINQAARKTNNIHEAFTVQRDPVKGTWRLLEEEEAYQKGLNLVGGDPQELVKALRADAMAEFDRDAAGNIKKDGDGKPIKVQRKIVVDLIGGLNDTAWAQLEQRLDQDAENALRSTWNGGANRLVAALELTKPGSLARARAMFSESGSPKRLRAVLGGTGGDESYTYLARTIRDALKGGFDDALKGKQQALTQTSQTVGRRLFEPRSLGRA